MCGKVVRKEGMGRDSSKLQYKVWIIKHSLISCSENMAVSLYFVG